MQAPQPARRTDSTLSILQLILSGLGVAVLLAIAAVLVALGAGSGLMGARSGVGGASNLVTMLSRAAAALAIALALVPPALLAVARLQGRPLDRLRLGRPMQAASVALALWPVVLLLGFLAARTPQLTAVLLPPVQVLAVAIPVWFVFELGRRGLSAGGLQRGWGMLSFGLLPGPVLIIVLELVVIVGLVVAWAVWVSAQPGQAQSIQRLAEQLRGAGNNPQAMLEILRPLLARPGTVVAIVAIGGVLMPMLEELFKPLALWFLAGRLQHPAQGWVLGLAGGAAFGVIESLNLTSAFAGAGWVSVVAVRAITGLLHITTTGLVGWGLASAWTQGRYGRLALAFLGAVAIHGSWNTLSLLMGFDSVIPIFGQEIGSLGATALSWVGPAMLTALASGILLLLLIMNARLKSGLPVEPQPLDGAPAQPALPEIPPEPALGDTAPLKIDRRAPGAWSAEWPAAAAEAPGQGAEVPLPNETQESQEPKED